MGTNNPVNQRNNPEVLSPQQCHRILKPHKDLVTNWLPHEKLVGTHADTVAALKNYTLITFLSGFLPKVLYKFLSPHMTHALLKFLIEITLCDTEF